MSLLGLLLALWTWDRVITDCKGRPGTAAYYYFQATMRQHLPAWCEDEFGQLFDCGGSIAMPPIRFTGDIPDPGTGDFVTTTYDPVSNPNLLPQPPVGGLSAWPWFSPEVQPIVAVNLAEQKSGDPCP